MVIFHRAVGRLKDTFAFVRPNDDLKQQQQQQQRITGRRVLSTKKLRYLPSNGDTNQNMNFNEVSLRLPFHSSLKTERQMTKNHEHDFKQSKLKNLVIDELRNFFATRNQQQYEETDTEINSRWHSSILTHAYPSQQREKVHLTNK